MGYCKPSFPYSGGGRKAAGGASVKVKAVRVPEGLVDYCKPTFSRSVVGWKGSWWRPDVREGKRKRRHYCFLNASTVSHQTLYASWFR